MAKHDDGAATDSGCARAGAREVRGGPVWLREYPPDDRGRWMIQVGARKTITSQNTRDRMHWSQRAREAREWTILVRGALALMGERSSLYGASTRDRRHVTIKSIRPRRIMDVANLVGGAKPVPDALTKCGLIYDDSDEYVSIEYHQDTLRGRDPHTIITITPA